MGQVPGHIDDFQMLKWEECLCRSVMKDLLRLAGCIMRAFVSPDLWLSASTYYLIINFYLCAVRVYSALYGTPMWTPQNPNLKCWKYDSDRLESFWDMASQTQKSGALLFKQVRLLGKIQ